MTASISRDEWLKALKEAEDPGDPDAITAQEFASMFGIHRATAAVRLKRLVGAGKARTTSKRIYDSGGRGQMVAAYRLVKDDKRKGK
jgi:hypothetical protein